MPGMDMPGMAMKNGAVDTGTDAMQRMMKPQSLIDLILNHTTAGTSAEPVSTPVPMLMTERGGWMLMLHGNAFLVNAQQSGARGADKLFSTNWIMPMAQRELGPGRLTLRAMFSLEPATITHRYYPELFQQGETAYGAPIRDGQHPHDFWMEAAALYDIRIDEHTLISGYAAPVGDPAIGPTAYPHRWSASENPIATLSHHQQDSTHIAFNVFTVGVTHGPVRVEASGFHGQEPNEGRWHFEPSSNGHAVDSWATRLTVNPTRNISAQYSYAQITKPEAQAMGDQLRQTSSVMYNRSTGSSDKGSVPQGNLAVSLIWGRTDSGPEHVKQNSYMAEALYQFRRANYVTVRLENAARTSELLPGDLPEAPIGHVAAYTLGYDHDLRFVPHVRMAPGVQFTGYHSPAALRSTHETNSFGAQMFVRFRIDN